VAEADKLALGQELTVRVSHSILTLTEYKGNYWLTNSWMIKYQNMLCENSHIQLEVVRTLNPATLLLGTPRAQAPPELDCLEVMDEVFLSQPDLTDQPIGHLDVEYFIEGSSFIWDGTCFAGYAIVTLDFH
jgi:hypothetical protein